jgi:hypothetical protein
VGSLLTFASGKIKPISRDFMPVDGYVLKDTKDMKASVVNCFHSVRFQLFRVVAA